MTPSSLQDLSALVPRRDVMAPLRSLLLSSSRPRSRDRWSGSNALATWASRDVELDDFATRLPRLIERETEHLERTYRLMAEALDRLASGRHVPAAERLLELAAAEEGRDRPDLAESYSAAACAALADAAHSETYALARRRRARALRSLGRHQEAERDYARSCEIALALDDRPGAAEAAIGAGNVVEEEGHWGKAQGWYERALQIIEPLPRLLPQRWHALLNLHVVRRTVGDLEGARPLLVEAESVADGLNDDGAPQHIENARGQLALAESRVDDAIGHFRDALLATTVAFGHVTIRINLAEALLAADRPVEAMEEVRKAELIAIDTSLHRKLPEVYRLIGRIAAYDGNPDALVLFEQALGIIESHDLPRLERAITLQAYADAERRIGEPDTAAALAAEAADLYQSLGITSGRTQWADQFDAEDEPETP